MKIGKLFHLTPLVDDLNAAEAFFNNTFSPLCCYRDYSTHWHRDAAILTIADTVIEPMQPHPPADGQKATSWFRYIDKFGPKVHNIAFYVEDAEALGTRLTEAGIPWTNGGVPGNVFTYPRSTAPMLEFYEPTEHRPTDPRLSPHWAALRDDFWPNIQPMGILRLSHITVVVNDRAATLSMYKTVFEAVELPAQPASVPGAEATFVLFGEDTIIELAQPVAADCPIREDLETVGECVTGATFTVRALEAVERRLGFSETGPAWTRHGNRIDFDRKATWNCQYTLTESVLEGDPRLT
ncbi:MAG: VOC family protein [Acidimicrobiia bacterium]